MQNEELSKTEQNTNSDSQVIMTHETLKPMISVDDMLETINAVKNILINTKDLPNKDLVKMSIAFRDTISHIEEIKGDIK